jgi:hypothetical protein
MLRQIALGAALLGTGLVGTASAVIVTTPGGTPISSVNISQNAAQAVSSAVAGTPFTPIPGATTTVTVPAVPGPDGPPIGASPRTIVASFGAESQCNGAGTGWCSVRIVAIGPGGTVELNPVSGLDFAFDGNQAGAVDDLWEANSMQRAIRLLVAGTYTIRAEWAIVALGGVVTNFRFDDWNFEVQVLP